MGHSWSSLAIAVAAACGGNKQSNPDAPIVEIDTPGRMPVTVHADNANGNAANVHVVVNDADGAVVASLMTGADGDVASVVPEGGSISAFTSDSTSLYVNGAVDPAPGSRIVVFDGPAAMSGPASVSSYGITVDSIPVGTTQIEYTTPCGHNTTSVSGTSTYIPTSNAGCLAPDYPLEMFAMNGGVIYGYTAFQTLPLNPAALSTPTVTFVDISGSPTSPSSVEVHNIPSNLALGQSTRLTIGSRYLPNYAWNIALPGASVTVNGLAQQIAAAGYLPPGTFFTSDFEADYSDGAHFGSGIFQHRCDPTQQGTGPEIVYDALPLVIPSLGDPDFSTQARPQISWTTNGVQRGEGGSVTLVWHSGLLQGTSVYKIPPDSRLSFKAPELPAELASYAPSMVDYVRLDYFDGADTTGTFDYKHFVEGNGYVIQEPGPAHYFLTLSTWQK